MEPKVHDHVHSSLPLVPIARHMKLIHTLLSYFFNTHFNIIVQHAYIFQIVFFFQVIPQKSLIHLSAVSYMPPCLIPENVLVTLTNERLPTI